MSTLKVNNITDLGNDAVVTSGVLDTLAVPAGGILQVVSTSKTDLFTTTSTSWADITGYSATITPTSETSKILVMMNYIWSYQASDRLAVARILRDNTVVFSGDATANRASGSDSIWENPTVFQVRQIGLRNQVTFVDTPASTSALTYKMQVQSDSRGGGTVVFNSSAADGASPSGYYVRGASSITLMEVAG